MNSGIGREAMESICANCHSNQFFNEQYAKADSVTSFVNSKVEEASQIM